MGKRNDVVVACIHPYIPYTMATTTQWHSIQWAKAARNDDAGINGFSTRQGERGKERQARIDWNLCFDVASHGQRHNGPQHSTTAANQPHATDSEWTKSQCWRWLNGKRQQYMHTDRGQTLGLYLYGKWNKSAYYIQWCGVGTDQLMRWELATHTHTHIINKQ